MTTTASIPRWGCFEGGFTAAQPYANPFADLTLTVAWTSPSGRVTITDAFWDGGSLWRARFSPDETGEWRYLTTSHPAEFGLHQQSGRFICVESGGENRFAQHGPVQLSADRHYLAHADGTPFFWMSDTAWNAPLLSTPAEWDHYLAERVRQKFTAVQWVATHWLASPEGDAQGMKAFSGSDHITVHPEFFQRLDRKVAALNHAGLLNVPVLLWAAAWSNDEVEHNPGYTLPEDQAVRLARYMVARWSAYATVWILPGDGDYRGDKAARWKRIGRAVFGDAPHAPVSLHPGGEHWNLPEFSAESWLDIIGYQSGHGDGDETAAWLVKGPPTVDWAREPARPVINLEPPYENHIAYQSKKPHDAHSVRRSLYWSLLNAPTAGVSYGGHGVWGWDDGTKTPTAHPATGVPLPWAQALTMPAAEQVRHLVDLFTSLEWWRLRPAPEALLSQPGDKAAQRFISVSRYGDVLLVYTPEADAFDLRLESEPASAVWVDPRTGTRSPATLTRTANGDHLVPPGEGDWVLLLMGLNA